MNALNKTTINIRTRGHGDAVDLTEHIADLVDKKRLGYGLIHVHLTGTTASLILMEYEKGLLEDLGRALEKIAPSGSDYEHHRKWGDKNGAAHLKSAILGASLMVPTEKGKIQLGRWQRIVLIDFDERPRDREIIISQI